MDNNDRTETEPVKTSPVEKKPAQEQKNVKTVPQGPQDQRTATQDQEATPAQKSEPAVEKAPEKSDAEKQSEELHQLDQHTGEGTAFPEGSPMAVVPPDKKQSI